MDDIKILQVSQKLVDRVIYQLTAKYGNVLPLSVSLGYVNNYLII